MGKMASERQLVLNSAKGVIVPSTFVADTVVGWGVEESRVRVIANGVRLPKSSIRRVPRQRDEKFRLIYVGRLTNYKGVETALLAISRLESTELTIVGSGPVSPLLFDLSRQLEIDSRVEFTGRLGPSETQARLARSHALVLPSLYEGMSHVLLEAMAMGLPSIVSDLPANREVVTDGLNAMLVPPQRPDHLVRAVNKLRTDDSLWRRISRNAHSRAEAFGLEDSLDQYVRLLTDRDPDTCRRKHPGSTGSATTG